MRRVAAIALLASLAGCGPSSYADFRNQLANRWCERQLRCGEVGGHDTTHCGVPAPLALTIPGRVDVASEIAANRLLFHPDNASECLDAVQHAPCDLAQAGEDFVRHCHGVVTAKAATGEACFGDEECVGGRCVQPVDGCGGTCVAFAAYGASCKDGGDPATTCDPTVAFCDGVCKQKGQRGDACASDDQCLFAGVCVGGKCSDVPRLGAGDVCGTDLPLCDDDLWCDESFTCTDRGKPGAACTRENGCQDGYVCLGGKCSAWLDVGGACAAAMPSGCPATQTCASGACAVAGGVKTGPHFPCKSDGDCADGLYCTGSYCEYLGGERAPCTAANACAPGLSCDATTKSCRLPVSCPAAM